MRFCQDCDTLWDVDIYFFMNRLGYFEREREEMGIPDPGDPVGGSEGDTPLMVNRFSTPDNRISETELGELCFIHIRVARPYDERYDLFHTELSVAGLSSEYCEHYAHQLASEQRTDVEFTSSDAERYYNFVVERERRVFLDELDRLGDAVDRVGNNWAWGKIKKKYF